MNSEVVVKYFDHQGVSGHENKIQWFKGQCHCQICKPSWDVLITHYTDTDDPSYCRAIGILDPAQQSKLCYDMSDYHPGALSSGYPHNQYKKRIDYPPPVINTVFFLLIIGIINKSFESVINSNVGFIIN
jgi:hypothetical protein